MFLSYARDELEKADALATALQSLGLRTFLDVDDGINAGDSFPQRISNAIRDSKAVLACWSRDALARDWVRRECMMARDMGKLVAVAVDTLSPTDLPTESYDTSFEDLTGFTGEVRHWGWSQTCRALATRIESWAEGHAQEGEALRALDLAGALRKAALAARPEGMAPTGGVVASSSAAARAWETLKDSTDWRALLEFAKSFPGTDEGYRATVRGNELRKKAAKADWLKCCNECDDRLQRELDYCSREYGSIGPNRPLWEACRREAFQKNEPRKSECREETLRRFGVDPFAS